MQLELSEPVDCVADFTYDFYWQHRGAKLKPDDPIPHQEGSNYTYRDVVEALKRKENIFILGDVGHRFCSSFGVDLRFFSGSGGKIPVGNIIVDGDVDTRMGISMVSGAIYVAGAVKPPIGNVVEVASDRTGYQKYRSITDVVCNGLGDDTLAPLTFFQTHNSIYLIRLCAIPLAHVVHVTRRSALLETLTSAPAFS